MKQIGKFVEFVENSMKVRGIWQKMKEHKYALDKGDEEIAW